MDENFQFVNKPDDKIIGKKEKIKVIILVDSDHNSNNYSYAASHIRKDGVITNYPYDAWLKIQSELEKYNKYEFEVQYTDPKTASYSKTFNLIKEGKYDIAVALFYNKNEREEHADATLPLALDGLGVIYKKEKYDTQKFFNILKKLVNVFLFMIVVGIIMGIILYIFEPSRADTVLEHKGISGERTNFLKFKRIILTTIAAMFGEMGFLSENSVLTVKGFITVITMFILAYIFIAYIQSEIITTILEDSTDEILNMDKIADLKLIALKGFSDKDKIERHVKLNNIEMIKGNVGDLEKRVMSDDKIDAAIMGVIDGYNIWSKNDNIAKSFDNFDKTFTYFFVNKRKKYLLEDINRVMVKLYNSLELQKICKSYFKEPDFICSVLS